MEQRHRAPALTPHALLAVSLLAGCSSGGGGPTPGELAVTAATATAPVGPDNDVVTVTFASNVIEAQVVNPANWDVEHPIGTPFDLTGATIDYDPTTLVATITLGPGTVGSLANGNNLQTRESIRVTWNAVTGVAGETVTGEPSVVVTGDTTEPNILSVSADGVETTLRIEFDEWTRQIGFGELYTGTPGDPGPHFRLIDADGTPAVPATGTVTIASQPNDGDTIALDDGTRQVLFEFDDNASVVNTANLRAVVIGLDEIETATHLTTAINGPGFTFDIEAAHSTTVAEGVNLSNPVAGANGNTVIQTTNPAAVTVVGFTGGVDAEPLVREPVGGGFAWAADGTRATIDFAPAIPDPDDDSIEIYGVRDLAGNQAFAEASFPLTAADPSDPAPLGTSAFIAQGGYSKIRPESSSQRR